MPSPGSLSPSVASFQTMTDPDNAAAERERTDRSTLLITVPSATIAFGVAFNLGAFDTVFFDAILAVWVTATIVLIASVISPTLPPRHWSGRPRGCLGWDLGKNLFLTVFARDERGIFPGDSFARRH